MRFWENRRTRSALFLLLAVGYGFSAAHRQVKSGNDFPIYLDAARALLRGGSPYSPEPGLNGYVYLPFFALVLSPLSFLPEIVAIWLWYFGNVLLTVAAFRLTKSLLEDAIGPAHAAWSVWLALLVHLRFFLDNYDMGQSNVLTLVLGLVGLRLAIVRSRDWIAGAAIGGMVAIKPYGAMLLVPFLARGRWRVAAGAAGALTAAMLLVPALAVGPSVTATALADWKDKIVGPSLDGELQGSSIWDQSPQAGLRRLVVDETCFKETKINFLSVSPETYRRLCRILQIALAAALVAAWSRARRSDAPGLVLADAALALVAMVVLFGYNLRAHFVVLLLPWALLAALLRRESPRGRIAAALLALASALIFWTSPGLIGRTASNWLLAYSAVTVGTLLQMALLVRARIAWRFVGVAAGTDPSRFPSSRS
jgi:hypothetical protein